MRFCETKTFLMKLNMINFILLVLLLLISMVLLMHNSPLVIHFISPLVIHFKVRPIVSSIDTFDYNLARFLCDLVSPLVLNDYSHKDTFSFVSQMKNGSLSEKYFLSYDVTSLFTNIPLQKNTDIAINLIFNPNPNLNIAKRELKKLFLFVTSQTHFIFNSKFYNQTDEVAMGSL